MAAMHKRSKKVVTISSNSESPDGKHGNWLELPWDVTISILMKLGALEILESAQLVCKMWYNLCKDPSMWRTIHIENVNAELKVKHEKVMQNLVDRNAKGLMVLSIDNFGSDKLLSHVASRASQLKRLRLAWCRNLSAKALIEALKKLSSLEELELTFCWFGAETIPIIHSCPSLTTFKLNKLGSKDSSCACDKEALAIARSMPNLRRLQLNGNDITDVGLTAILDGCQHLRYLDMRACFHLNLVGNLGKRLSQHIKKFRHPLDSSEHFNYDFKELSDTDYDLPAQDESYIF